MSIMLSIMDRAGFKANTDIMVIVDAEHQRLIWVPRDLWSTIVGDRLNAAYSIGGHSRLLEALTEYGLAADASLCLSREATEAALSTVQVLMPIPVRMEFSYPLEPTKPIEEGAKQIEFNPPAEILRGERIHQWIGARGETDLHRIERQKLLLRRLLDQRFDFSSVLENSSWYQASSAELFDELSLVRSSWAFTTYDQFRDQLIGGKAVLVADAHYPVMEPAKPRTPAERVQRLTALLALLDVEHNPHYQPRREYGTFPDGTYCNVFAADVVNNFRMSHGTVYGFTYDSEPSHNFPQLRDSGLSIDGYALPPLAPDGTWLNVAQQVDWLNGARSMQGPSAAARGWANVGSAQAEHAAKEGWPVLVAIARDSKEHMAILLPSQEPNALPGALRVAHTGETAAANISVDESFGASEVLFYRYSPPDYSVLHKIIREYAVANNPIVRTVNVSYAFVDVHSGQLITTNGRVSRPAMGLFKPVLAACYLWLVENEYIDGQPEDFEHMSTMLFRDIRSNQATTSIFQAIGGIAILNDWMVDQGFSPVSNHMTRWPLAGAELSTKSELLQEDDRGYRNISTLFLRGDNGAADFAVNLITPAELSHFLARIYRGDVLDETGRARWTELMSGGHDAPLLFGEPFADDGAKVYAIEGQLPTARDDQWRQFCETGIVETPQGAYALTVTAADRSEFMVRTVLSNLGSMTYALFGQVESRYA